MSILSKFLSFFSREKDTEGVNVLDNTSSQTQESNYKKEKTQVTIGDLKRWSEVHLPPFSYQRIVLRLTKTAFADYGIFLNQQPDDYVLPELLYQKAKDIIEELYNVEVKIYE